MVHQSVCKDDYGNSDQRDLIQAVWEKKIKFVRQYIEAGVNVNAVYKGTTALYAACDTCCPEIVELLLENGADPSIKHWTGSSPLWIAARRGCEKIVKLLVECKANINHCKDNVSALMVAVEYRRYNVICVLLNEGASTDLRDNQGKTVLHRACEMDGKNLLRIINGLITAGADVDGVSNNGETPSMLAAKNGHLEIIKLLVKAQANMNVVSDDPNYGTALHCAAANNYLPTCKYLMRRTSILQNCVGLMPSDIAKRNKHGIAEYLMEREAQRINNHTTSTMGQCKLGSGVIGDESSVAEQVIFHPVLHMQAVGTRNQTSTGPEIHMCDVNQDMSSDEDITMSESVVCQDMSLRESGVHQGRNATESDVSQDMSKGKSGICQDTSMGASSVCQDRSMGESGAVGHDVTLCKPDGNQNINIGETGVASDMVCQRAPFMQNEGRPRNAEPQNWTELADAEYYPRFWQEKLHQLQLYIGELVKEETRDLHSHIDKKFDSQLESLGGSHFANEQYQSPILSKNCTKLLDNFNLTENFINELCSEGVVTYDEKSIILTESSRLGKMKRLLRFLDDKGETSIFFFIVALCGDSSDINRELGEELEKDYERF